MRCDRFREAISARIDGEDPGLPDGALDAHLGVCADCRAWQQRAHVVTRRARLGGPFPGHDLTAQVLAAAPAGGSPGFPGGGEAAAVPVPGIAARTGDRVPLPDGPGDGKRPAGSGGAEAVA